MSKPISSIGLALAKAFIIAVNELRFVKDHLPEDDHEGHKAVKQVLFKSITIIAEGALEGKEVSWDKLFEQLDILAVTKGYAFGKHPELFLKFQLAYASGAFEVEGLDDV